MKTDILIAGSGCSALYCAINLPKDKKITVITKTTLTENDSFLAQGGICVKRDDNDFDSFFDDTLKAGHFENNKESVEIMINSSRDVINDLIGFGVEFNKAGDGSLDYTREAAHSRSRILYHKDITGKEITSKLLSYAKSFKNITFMENTVLFDIIENDGECVGAVVKRSDGKIDTVSCGYTVLATGGIGGLFRHSTNYRHLTGDAIAIALKHNVKLKDIDYIQIHPTTFYNKNENDRSFLISESVRGEGAKLLNKKMERFVDELLPRDLLSEAINEQMRKDGTNFVWEDLRTIPKDELISHFPNIIKHCKENGYDVFNECIPVVPAQHYFMGGIEVDTYSRTSMKRLFAIGETACNGVHGKNRLASNSLLESLVFAKRAALDIADKNLTIKELPYIDLSQYADTNELSNRYKKAILDEIQRRKHNV